MCVRSRQDGANWRIYARGGSEAVSEHDTLPASGDASPLLMVATPAFGDMFHGGYVRSMLGLQALAMHVGLSMTTLTKNNSLIALSRNDCVATFREVKVQTDPNAAPRHFTHLLFIDADITFNPHDVLRMLSHNLPVVAGSYPLKEFDWERMAELVKAGEPVDASLPAKASGSVIGLLELRGEGKQQDEHHRVTLDLNEKGLGRIDSIGAGFLMIRRDTFDTLEEKLGERLKRYTAPNGTAEGAKHTCFFNTQPSGGRYIGEDVFFCERLREAGIPLWLDAHVQLQHTGSYTFSGGGALV